MDWICSVCGAPAYYDGRCGDDLVLFCGCNQGEWVDDGRGGYFTNPTGAKPGKGNAKKGTGTGKRKIIIIINDE